MEVKKHPSKDIRNKRFDFFLVGLAVTLLFVFGAFSYTQYEEKETVLEDFVVDEEVIVMENTVQQKEKPPPPPPELEVVEDDEEIEEDNPEIEIFELDQDDAMIEYEDFEEAEPEETNEVFDVFAVSDQALFMGKEVQSELRKYLAENLRYPDAAREAEVQGVVVVTFVVNKAGNVENVQVITPPKRFGLEDEAIRIIKSTSGMWTPAKQRTVAVNVRYQIPINFQLY
ncbi:TonB family protein [bacterium]|nr:TonB family protein [bacterium]